jgi:hypothetical protein
MNKQTRKVYKMLWLGNLIKMAGWKTKNKWKVLRESGCEDTKWNDMAQNNVEKQILASALLNTWVLLIQNKLLP